jgi:hypothetical protein
MKLCFFDVFNGAAARVLASRHGNGTAGRVL